MKLTLDNLHMYGDAEGECLLWKLSLNGRGKPQARLGPDNKNQMVQRYVYTELMGKTLERGRRVSTRCMNPICISPDCLIGLTFSQIQKRSYAKGGRSTAAEYAKRLARFVKEGRTKLTPEIVVELRASDEPHVDAARRLGVRPDTVRCARSGASWRIGGASVFSWRPQVECADLPVRRKVVNAAEVKANKLGPASVWELA